MLRFLQSIFGGVEPGSYPESLVTEAIERAVDATDSQVRAVSGYQKKLRPAVLRAIDHVVALVEGLPLPLPATGTSSSRWLTTCWAATTTCCSPTTRPISTARTR